MAKCRHHGTRRLNIKKIEIYHPSRYSRNFIHVSKLLQPWGGNFFIINDLLDRVRPPIGKKKKTPIGKKIAGKFWAVAAFPAVAPLYLMNKRKY